MNQKEAGNFGELTTLMQHWNPVHQSPRPRPVPSLARQTLEFTRRLCVQNKQNIIIMARSIAVCIVVLLALFEVGSCLKCYVCNSQTDPNCADPSSGKSKLVDCNDPEVMSSNQKYLYNILPSEVFSGIPGAHKACHKIVMQTGTVARTCLDANPSFLKTTCDTIMKNSQSAGPEKKIKSCEVCDKDNCNGAASLSFSLPLAFLALVATYLLCKQ